MKTKPDPDLLSITTDKDAPYERFDEAMVMVKAAGITKISFAGNPTTF